MTETIGIIGSGLSGSGLARLAVAAGYRVVLSNSRGPATISGLVEELGPLARAATVEEAIAAGDLVAIPLPLANVEALPADRLAGKVVIDQTNYYPAAGAFRRADLDNAELTSSELVQRHLRESKVVKAFHNLDWHHLSHNARPRGHAERTTLPVAGDDADAKERVARFVAAVGYDVVDAGSLADSWRVEPNTPIYFWPYAPVIPAGLTEDEEKKYYLEHSGAPLSPEAARKLIDGAERPSPVGGTLEGLPPAHVAIFLDLARAGTFQR
ncbi:NADPH-dependent F420 reductase [Streptomyces sp. DSM 44915]|uniref:NADPH-dependent F420 reductase n=1 Tax=Streptomyces chisholmiae TaxID=3075540 RepID=A0ABU2K1A8_9ACTN|nr:NADPH-dependent F420 reductase [Streptomyces sp. DSM 44915]MDT0270789.1 NADPH-dependent F420 reductase [Streptomyces sp. DSM 44915]